MRRPAQGQRDAISLPKCRYWIGMTMITSIGKYLFGAAAFGGVAGYGSMMTTPEGRDQVSARLAYMAQRTGEAVDDIAETRDRPPQPGDFWGGCNDARNAGTAPIYRGEPGYRPNMDGDNDGIACEPHY